MTLGDLIRTASGNLGRRKVRTLLTTIGVIVGITTIVAMLSLAVGVQREIRSQFEAIGLENVFVEPQERESGFDDFTFTRPERVRPITRETVEEWRKLPGVVSVEPGIEVERSINTALLINGEEQEVRIDTSFFITDPFEQPPTAIAGKLEPEGPEDVVLGRRLVSDLSDEQIAALVGKQVELIVRAPRGEQQSFTFTVAGVSSNDRRAIWLSVEGRAAIKSWWYNSPDLVAEEGYDYVMVRGQDIVAARNIVAAIRPGGYEVRSLETILELASRIFTVINVMIGSVGGLALFVATIGIINTMIMAIYERTREIGTLKAIGASRGEIRAMFMVEAGLIGLLGGSLGLIFGWLIGLGLDRLAIWYLEREKIPLRGDFFVVPSWLALCALGFAILVGVLAGLYPAARAARLDPIAALRHE